MKDKLAESKIVICKEELRIIFFNVVDLLRHNMERFNYFFILKNRIPQQTIILLSLLLCMSKVKAQSSSEIYKQLKKLNFLGSVLYLAAHPDDENTRVISYFSNHVLARTAYLSITRGDGGQNLIGSELREALGLIRTQELLAARNIDGGKQFFTMANDFGYSKSSEETLSIWDKKQVLAQTIENIQRFKPDIIINRFDSSGLRRTHGHHTASAIISEWAFEQLHADQNSWHPKRMFHNTSRYFYGSQMNFDKANKQNIIAIDMGGYDPLLGKTNSEIAAQSRSQHKSQGFGSSASIGEKIEYLKLVKGKKITSNDPFDGINTMWTRLKGGSPIRETIIKIIQDFNFSAPYESVIQLLEVKKMISNLEDEHWKKIKIEEINSIILNCLGMEIQLNSQIPYGVKGEELIIKLLVNNPSPLSVSLDNIKWKDKSVDINKSLGTNLLFSKSFETRVTGPISSPYWLLQKGSDGMYKSNYKQWIGYANTPPAYLAELNFSIEGKKFCSILPIQYRRTDPVKGEVVTPFQILPKAVLQLDEPVYLFKTNQTRRVKASVKNLGPSFKGKLKLEVQNSWEVSPKSIEVNLSSKDSESDFYFDVKAPLEPALGFLKPTLQTQTKSLEASLLEISYDHIPKQYLVSPARSKVVALNLKKGIENVAYIEGAGDNIPQCLSSLGINVEIFKANNITLKKLTPFDAVIVGIRAFNVEEALAYKNKILWKYAEDGGNLLIQYNTSRGLKTKELTPFTLSLSRERVSNEKAKVYFINSKHPILNYPNKITAQDFDGWVQERGLYFPNNWDNKFIPLFQMSDAGESPKMGSLLVAQYGKGRIVYTGLSFFRQLPAGVPGAYRLFFNLIAKP